MKTFLRLLIGSAALLALSTLAMADSIDLTVPNPGLSGTPGPYATVTWLLSGADIHVSVDGYPGFEFFGQGNQGNDGIFGFNVVGSTAGLAITNISWNGSTPITWGGGGGQMDGFGQFDVVLSDGNPQAGHTVFIFDVSRTAGFSSASDIFEASSSGAHFAAHVAPTNGNPTGFAGDGGTPVPEPTSMLLLGSGLFALGVLGRRWIK